MLLAVLVPLVIVSQVSVPSNIDAGMLQPHILDLLQRSASFRQQCARIAATRVLKLTLRIGTGLDDGARAQTVINRYQAGSIRAEVTLRFGEDYLELLAHEFEHILEQVDGVNLKDEVAYGRAWQTRSGAFETRRAHTAGVRARQEWDELAPVAAQMDALKSPAARQPIH